MSISQEATDAQFYERVMVDIKAALATLNATVESGIDLKLATGRDGWEACRVLSLLQEINNPTVTADVRDQIIYEQRIEFFHKTTEKFR